MSLNKFSSPEEKKNASEAVFELLSDFFFNQINFISYAFSEVTNGGYTGTSDFRGWSRLPNTAGGKFLVTDKRSRMRCQFYALDPEKMIGYILSPALFDSDTSLNTISSMDILRAYAGIKIDEGILSVAIKEAGKSEVLYDTDIALRGSGVSETYKLEIVEGAKSVSITIDDVLIGVYPADFSTGFSQPNSYLPLLSPAKSTDGTAINIVIENFQYIQDK